MKLGFVKAMFQTNTERPHWKFLRFLPKSLAVYLDKMFCHLIYASPPAVPEIACSAIRVVEDQPGGSADCV